MTDAELRAALALAVLVAAPGVVSAACYCLLTPTRKAHPILPWRGLGRMLYGLAYGLSILRLPFAVLPYLAKAIILLCFPSFYNRYWQNHSGWLVIRLLGDLLNFAITSFLLRSMGGLIAEIAILAELLRLVFEKGQIVISAAWQMLPHRALATRLSNKSGLLGRYCAYYSLPDEARIEAILTAIRQFSREDDEAARKIGSVRDLRIVPDLVGLGAGRVRDVAAGEVFIHRRWTADPFLLIGIAMRRGPWLFDPRWLGRPFYYRTQGNRLMTLFVLEHATYCLPFALYQFGNEIKSARYDLFHRLLANVGLDYDWPVQEDGTYLFDPLLIRVSGKAAPAGRPLWSDAEVIADLSGCHLTAHEIAERYTYPLEYIEDVLLPAIEAANAAPL
jgi:hypothetical protein